MRSTLLNACIDSTTDANIRVPFYSDLSRMQAKDEVQDQILRAVMRSSEPLETKEIRDMVATILGEGEVTRSKLLYRLNDLRGRGEINGKSIGSGKGVWIWWKNSRK